VAAAVVEETIDTTAQSKVSKTPDTLGGDVEATAGVSVEVAEI
jgi:hypothetical protein